MEFDRELAVKIVAGIGAMALVGVVGWKLYTSWRDSQGGGDGGSGKPGANYGSLNVIQNSETGEITGKITTVPDPITGRLLLTPVQPDLVTKTPCPNGYYKDLGDAMRAAGGGSGNWRFDIAPGTTDCLKVIKL